MFSSGNRSKENNQNYPTQWALNPSAYQNVSNENVDWAALAQQWIMMKESVPPEHPPAGASSRKEILNEGGEAPMDVEKEDADEPWSNNESSNTGVHDSWNWQQWGSWPNNWNGPPPAAGIVPQPATASPLNKTALLPTPYTHFTSDSNSAHSTDYQSYDGPASSGGNEFSGNSSGYWTNSGSTGRGKHPVKPNRTHRKGFVPDIRPEPSTEPVTLDAAKRRQLPAWIREGLEKMEREKQKQLDRERERLEQEELLKLKKEEKQEALELLRSADGNILPPKSKFDSDSGDSGDENVNGSNSRSRQSTSKSRRPMTSSRASSPLLALTEEERMGMVRRAMTEVLLQVTSSEIDTICQEEMNRFRSRTTASAKKGGRPAAPSASPFAAGTLGLGMYGGGSSDSESENERPGSTPVADDNDRRNSFSLNNSVHEDGLESKQQNKDSTRRRSSDSQSKKIQESRDTESSDTTIDDDKESGEQVDTTRLHGKGSSRSRSDRRRRSSSSNSISSTSSSRTSSSETSKNKRRKKKSSTPKKKSHGRSPRRHRRSSSSQSDDDSSSESKSNDSRTTSTRRNLQSRRHRSRSVESDKRRAGPTSSGTNRRRRTECSRSGSSESESRDRRRTDSYTDRSRRERSSSRSRHSARNRRTRSRSRTRSRDRKNRRTRSRTRSRDRRDSYRSRRRSRSRTRSRSGGGKRTRGH